MQKEFTMPLNVTITTRYAEEDTEFMEDYCEKQIEINGESFLVFGDYYHDKGSEKTEAVIQTLENIYGEKNINITRKEIADFEI